MAIPDKLSYTKGERFAEIFSGALSAGFAAAMIVMTAGGIADGGNIILIVVMLIIYGVFTLCSVFPQHANIFSKPEKTSEKAFRKARISFIIAKIVFASAIFALSLPIFPK